jgi:hypothetical protein
MIYVNLQVFAVAFLEVSAVGAFQVFRDLAPDYSHVF